MFEIKKDRPLPPRAMPTLKSQMIETMKAMEVGDSFQLPEKSGLESSIKGYVYTASKAAGVKCTAKKYEGATVVWRIA